MIVSIHQPNYIPWIGYFRKIIQSDLFVFFDNVQMPRGKSFISRNAIKTSNGRMWLTVPVEGKSKMVKVQDVKVVKDGWEKKHIRAISLNYSNSPWLDMVCEEYSSVLFGAYDYLADLNIEMVKTIVRILGYEAVRFIRASELSLEESGADSIIGILQKTNASTYLTGSGKGTDRHLDIEQMEQHGISVRFVSNEFSEYEQRYPPFEPNLSIMDVLLSCGPEKTRRLLEER